LYGFLPRESVKVYPAWASCFKGLISRGGGAQSLKLIQEEAFLIIYFAKEERK